MSLILVTNPFRTTNPLIFCTIKLLRDLKISLKFLKLYLNHFKAEHAVKISSSKQPINSLVSTIASFTKTKLNQRYFNSQQRKFWSFEENVD